MNKRIINTMLIVAVSLVSSCYAEYSTMSNSVTHEAKAKKPSCNKKSCKKSTKNVDENKKRTWLTNKPRRDHAKMGEHQNVLLQKHQEKLQNKKTKTTLI